MSDASPPTKAADEGSFDISNVDNSSQNKRLMAIGDTITRIRALRQQLFDDASERDPLYWTPAPDGLDVEHGGSGAAPAAALLAAPHRSALFPTPWAPAAASLGAPGSALVRPASASTSRGPPHHLSSAAPGSGAGVSDRAYPRDPPLAMAAAADGAAGAQGDEPPGEAVAPGFDEPGGLAQRKLLALKSTQARTVVFRFDLSS